MKRASHNTRQYNKKAISRTTIFEFAGKRIFRFRMGGGPLRGAEGVEDGLDLHPGEDALAFLVAQLHEGVHQSGVTLQLLLEPLHAGAGGEDVAAIGRNQLVLAVRTNNGGVAFRFHRARYLSLIDV